MALLLTFVIGPLVLAGCGSPSSGGSSLIKAIGAENEYANVISQIGGRYVSVSSILDNPNTDPHTFEASPSVAAKVSAAKLIVQNGVGYDDFMTKIEAQASSSGQTVLVAQKILGLPTDTRNPHLWYAPTTVPKVAQAITDALARLQPSHRQYFDARLRRFDRALKSWMSAIAAFKARYGGTPVAVTEPVADYLLKAMGMRNLTPFRFQANIMNGVDPSPQDVSFEEHLLKQHRVKVFCYNAQVVDPLTASIRRVAKRAGVPVVAVYETMPTPGYNYQSWMLAETKAIEKAVAHGTSTGSL